MNLSNFAIEENTYASLKRLRWIASRLNPGDRILEIGCGTGLMITRPLLQLGFHIQGIDTDEKSIQFGRQEFIRLKSDPSCLEIASVEDLKGAYDKVILSEVLEHLHKEEMVSFLEKVREHLSVNGLVLITVPNGYGWFEIEMFTWYKLRLGKLLEMMGLVYLIIEFKRRCLGSQELHNESPSTLAASPHLRRFTFRSFQKELNSCGYQVLDAGGTSFFSGPFSNLLITGFNFLMSLNNQLASFLPRLSSGFFFVVKPRSRE